MILNTIFSIIHFYVMAFIQANYFPIAFYTRIVPLLFFKALRRVGKPSWMSKLSAGIAVGVRQWTAQKKP